MKTLAKVLGEDLFSTITAAPTAAGEAEKPREKNEIRSRLKHLSAERYKQGDFFIANILDANPRDDLASMEHPIFALQAGDKKIREYERNGVKLTVKPGYDGCATIHDKDVWIYCISQLVAAEELGREGLGRKVQFTAYDFLHATNRDTGGVAYKRFLQALRRLSGTRLETSIETGGKKAASGFGLIDSWDLVQDSTGKLKKDGDPRMLAVQVTLPDWLYRAVRSHQLLAIHRDYFRLRKPLDRRVYELARKHCGTQPMWRASLQTLHDKTGSTAPIRNFRGAIKSLAETNELPGYTVDLTDDVVTFRPDPDRVILPKRKKSTAPRNT